ncbi:hypothetical protein Pint_09971 [Pistacia integerrima]|uniref:Uncharacterized protein n=1 Tax=Pistacia integerrima TaxID=434235 RepID=A0ACC0XK67_9ROSI|nr:hypothetical protein Pint_09971 [Pistacia integerrima]
MATQQLITENKEGAEIHHGADLCKQKCHELLAEFNLPKGLLPLNDLTEIGYNRTTGFLVAQAKLMKCVLKDPSSGKVKFTSAAGLSMSFPLSAFELEEKDQK